MLNEQIQPLGGIMPTQIFIKNGHLVVNAEHPISSRLKRYIILSFHPRSLLIHMIGALWAFYSLWFRQAEMAMGILMFTSLMAFGAVNDIDPQAVKKSTLGKLALLHLEPINLLTQIIGYIIFAIGFWTHSAESILCGISLVLGGHLYGWNRVFKTFAADTE
jgi:hypothetical protein